MLLARHVCFCFALIICGTVAVAAANGTISETGTTVEESAATHSKEHTIYDYNKEKTAQKTETYYSHAKKEEYDNTMKEIRSISETTDQVVSDAAETISYFKQKAKYTKRGVEKFSDELDDLIKDIDYYSDSLEKTEQCIETSKNVTEDIKTKELPVIIKFKDALADAKDARHEAELAIIQAHFKESMAEVDIAVTKANKAYDKAFAAKEELDKFKKEIGNSIEADKLCIAKIKATELFRRALKADRDTKLLVITANKQKQHSEQLLQHATDIVNEFDKQPQELKQLLSSCTSEAHSISNMVFQIKWNSKEIAKNRKQCKTVLAKVFNDDTSDINELNKVIDKAADPVHNAEKYYDQAATAANTATNSLNELQQLVEQVHLRAIIIRREAAAANTQRQTDSAIPQTTDRQRGLPSAEGKTKADSAAPLATLHICLTLVMCAFLLATVLS